MNRDYLKLVWISSDPEDAHRTYERRFNASNINVEWIFRLDEAKRRFDDEKIYDVDYIIMDSTSFVNQNANNPISVVINAVRTKFQLRPVPMGIITENDSDASEIKVLYPEVNTINLQDLSFNIDGVIESIVNASLRIEDNIIQTTFSSLFVAMDNMKFSEGDKHVYVELLKCATARNKSEIKGEDIRHFFDLTFDRLMAVGVIPTCIRENLTGCIRIISGQYQSDRKSGKYFWFPKGTVVPENLGNMLMPMYRILSEKIHEGTDHKNELRSFVFLMAQYIIEVDEFIKNNCKEENERRIKHSFTPPYL